MFQCVIPFFLSSAQYFFYCQKNYKNYLLYIIWEVYKIIILIQQPNICLINKNLNCAKFIIHYNNKFFALWRFYIHYSLSYSFGNNSLCLRFKSKYFLLAAISTQILQLWVGYSHLTFSASSLIFIKKVHQYLLFFYSRDIILLFQFARFYRHFKDYNCYTLRGIRLSHDKFQRRLGKIKRFI